MNKNLSQDSKMIKKTKQKKGRPTKQERQTIHKRFHNDIMRIADFPELINIYKTISMQSNVLVNIKTGPNQDEQMQQIVSTANMKQEKQLSLLKKDQKYTYFLKNKNDKVHLEGDNIIELNEQITIQKPFWISSDYQQVYNRLNILVKQLDDEFIPEFMYIVNSFIDSIDQNIDKRVIINTLIYNIKASDEHKILNEWRKLKSEIYDLQIHYKEEDLKKQKSLNDQKSENIRMKYEELINEEQQQINSLKQFKCPFEYFIRQLVQDIDYLIQSVRV